MWFESLFGFIESKNIKFLKDSFDVDHKNGLLTSLVNGKVFQIGKFSTPSLGQLRALGTASLDSYKSSEAYSLDTKFKFDHVVQGDVLMEHHKFPGALFQAASQFNCLEFSSWKCTPEKGVSIYSSDRTQGPACALACPAGTVYRNYFAEVPVYTAESGAGNATSARSQIGQTADNQLNNLDKLEEILDNKCNNYWNVTNGYTFTQHESNLERLSAVLHAAQQNGTYDELLSHLKIGLHADVGVTFRSRFDDVIDKSEGINVTQVYASALSCAYSGVKNECWAPFARLVLQATYEATLWAALLNNLRNEDDSDNPLFFHTEKDSSEGEKSISETGTATGTCTGTGTGTGASATGSAASFNGTGAEAVHRPYREHVFLTLLGGGVFGNDIEWIADAIGRALAIMHVHDAPLHVHVCHFRRQDEQCVALVQEAFEKYVKIFKSG
jgi:hypothetical protein